MNKNPKTIHETAVKNIITSIKDGITGFRDVEGGNSNYRKTIGSYSSLARATDAATLVYPVLCSKSLNISSATMVSKAIEQKGVSMLRIAFSLFNITHDTDAVSYLKQFHVNLDKSSSVSIDDVEKFINFMDTVTESTNIPMVRPEIYKAIQEDSKINLNYFFESDINESSINDYKIINRMGNNIVLEAKPEYDENAWRDEDEKVSEREKENYKRYRDSKNDWNNERRDHYDKMRSDRDDKKYNMDVAKNTADMIRNQLLSGEVKKANELSPTMVLVNFFVNNKDKDLHVERQLVIGVKAKLYDVEPNDIISRIIVKNSDSNLLLKIIKASTREISFVKDILFAVDNAKMDASSRSRKGSAVKLFKALERRSVKGKIRRLMRNSDDAKAISTLVISQEEVDQLRKYNNIDVESTKIIIPIMEKLNLLYFVIIDEAMETAKFLCDGDTEYEILTFDNLQKETNDQGYKKAINLMSKVVR